MIHALVTTHDGEQRLIVSPSVIPIRDYAEAMGLQLRVFRPHEIIAVGHMDDYDDQPARMVRYRNDLDAKREILTTLSEFAHEYDVDQIFAEVFEWRVSLDDQGNELAHSAGFEMIASDYWAVVIKHIK